MKVIGLLGGIGSGKSTIAQQLMELGAHKIDADKVGHEILSDEDVRHAVKNRWGEFVFDENGWIDRARLAKMVFGNAEGESSSRILESVPRYNVDCKCFEMLVPKLSFWMPQC